MASAKNPQSQQEVQEIRQAIRKAGLRCTPARVSVMRELRASKSPRTHAELAERLVPLGFDKTTVFRNLADLTDADLLRRTELGDHVWRFEPRDPSDAATGGHPHFVCIDCGDVTCLDEMEFTAASKRRSQQIGRITEILIRGHCSACEENPTAVH